MQSKNQSPNETKTFKSKLVLEYQNCLERTRDGSVNSRSQKFLAQKQF